MGILSRTWLFLQTVPFLSNRRIHGCLFPHLSSEPQPCDRSPPSTAYLSVNDRWYCMLWYYTGMWASCLTSYFWDSQGHVKEMLEPLSPTVWCQRRADGIWPAEYNQLTARHDFLLCSRSEKYRDWRRVCEPRKPQSSLPFPVFFPRFYLEDMSAFLLWGPGSLRVLHAGTLERPMTSASSLASHLLCSQLCRSCLGKASLEMYVAAVPLPRLRYQVLLWHYRKW